MVFAKRRVSWPVRMTGWAVLGCSLASSGLAKAPADLPSRPLGDPGTWVTPNDYPTRALRNGETGTTGFSLSYDAQGKITACDITASSGSADLDARTCELMMARARLTPATREGKPISGVYANSVHWQIPETPNGDVPEPGSMSVGFTVHSDGHVSDCIVTNGKGVQQSIPAGSGPQRPAPMAPC